MLHLIIQTTTAEAVVSVVFTDFLECTIEVRRREYELLESQHEYTIEQGSQQFTLEEIRHEFTTTERRREFELPSQPAMFTVKNMAYEVDPLRQYTIAKGTAGIELSEDRNEYTVTQGKLHYTLSE